MPLLVNCPTGCQIRVPSNRAGRVVRCPKCKSAIRIAAFELPFVDNGQVVEVPAKLAKKKSEDSNKDTDESTIEELPVENELEQLDPAIQRVVKSPPRVPPVMHSRPWRRVEPLTSVQPSPDIQPLKLEIDSAGQDTADAASDSPSSSDCEKVSSPDANADRESKPRSDKSRRQPSDAHHPLPQIPGVAAFVDATDGTPTTSKIDQNQLAAIGSAAPVTKPPMINLDLTSRQEESTVDQKSWEQRLTDANSDRKMLTRFLAGCLLIIALINLVPALYHWRNWSTDQMLLPRWIYLQIFVGAIFSVYAVFLWQISDWSALRSVSVAMLVVAFLFGVISAGLLVGGNFASVLGVSFSLNRQAGIWCVAMLILATVMSYWSGKESANWRRSEILLHEIMQKTT
ncbi:MAG: hypothetical protein AAFN77_07550 [Planctomycetota bacterium]